MEIGYFVSLFSFLFVAAITPGPNNLLLTNSAARFGLLSSLPVMLGIILGMQLILSLVAFGVGSIILNYPAIDTLMQLAGSLYLIWLACRLITAPLPSAQNSEYCAFAVGWWQGAILQLVNPKAWLMTLGAVASFSHSGRYFTPSIVLISLALMLANLIAGLLWLSCGHAIRIWLATELAWRRFNLVMGLLTLASVGLLWL